jgi:hypothetical protein
MYTDLTSLINGLADTAASAWSTINDVLERCFKFHNGHPMFLWNRFKVIAQKLVHSIKARVNISL